VKKFIQIIPLIMMFWLPFLQVDCLKASQTDSPTTEQAVSNGYERAVNESARDIPLAYDVDVVVIGGTSGGVAAAVAAAERGAKVFLAAERPYLGEDICGTYRLWLEPDEVPTSPLAKKVFAETTVPSLLRNRIEFTYEADRTPAAMHRDTQPPALLTDGKWHDAASQSVQYDGDVAIIADLGTEYQLKKVYVMAYQRRNPEQGDDFEVKSVTVYLSSDRQQWKQTAAIKNKKLGEVLPESWGQVEFSALVAGKARYVKFLIEKSPDVNRVLLGEIVIEDDRPLAEFDRPAMRIPPTPMQVKRTLDEALLDAGVQFLYSCYATDVLHDSDGKLAGIVMANRSGRQAVKAKVIIDATSRATVARIAGADFESYPAGLQTFKYIVVGDQLQSDNKLMTRKMPAPILTSDGPARYAVEYTLKIPMENDSFASFAKAEQIARDKTWNPTVEDASEVLFQVPPDPLKGKKSLSGSWPGAEKIDLDVFRSRSVERLFVLGGCADVSRSAAAKLLRPLELMKIGNRIGEAAALQAKQIPTLVNVSVSGKALQAASPGDIYENLAGIRPAQKGLTSVSTEKRNVPVIGEYDVVVVGGGTGGAPAGIAAARQGAKALVVEYLHGLGGVGTMGYISSYYYGYIHGFTKEIDDGVAGYGGYGEAIRGRWNVEWKKEWYRSELRKAGADIWFGVLGCGAFVDNGCVKGVVVATDAGRGVVLAGTVIDSTGNADIAASAGASCVYTDGTNVAVQGAGLPPLKLGAGYTNTDWTFIDDGDVLDIWRTFVVAKKKYKDAYDLGQLLDTRERRRIVGDFTMSPMDISLGRTYPDTIVIARSNFDSHGFTIHPVFMIRPPDRKEISVNIPYRCLLPKGLDGILVTGLGVSAHRDAMPVIRMQADIQNQGYAAGVAAAMAAQSGKSVRDVDIKALQKHLVKKGNLPKRVLTDEDSFPLPQEKIADAVEHVVNDYDGLEIILAQRQEAIPLLEKTYENAKAENSKLVYAHILGMLGDSTGAGTLAEAIRSRDWDKGWNYTGMGQYGMSLSELDSLIVALGRTRDKRAPKAILEKVELLDAESEFSHCRAVAMALESIGDPVAAKPLAMLLSKPGMQGYALTNIDRARHEVSSSPTDTVTRNNSLRELVLARALYRCGDYHGLGEKILKEYAADLRAHYARHAGAVLQQKHGADETTVQ
jgi:NADPH-dependent 2,4-dienoyl-CoA reductase/sulfur reductase-like enzyme